MMKIILTCAYCLLLMAGVFTPVSDVLAATCTEDNWTYSDDPRIQFHDDAHLTQIGTCTGGVTHPAAETVSCIYRGVNYTCQPLSAYNVSIGTQVIVSTVQGLWMRSIRLTVKAAI